ncbi:Uma2 family endonuclease [Nocardia amamiensis]|uniref:Uma2 family endonuclease n=1 Tax=Nocardia amamiensis TaxID=404578 RepID=UPI000ABC2174|nr:Uma2 family endonuclease [Nocardia amamiensis]
MTADRPPKGDRAVLDWPVPPPGGYIAKDLDRLPDLPPHTELIDGSLVFVSPQMKFHMRVISFLDWELTQQAPEGWEVCREMTVTLGPRQRPEPDITIVDAVADTGLDQTTYQPADVVLAVEVVSPDSVERDRKRKPQLYAQAGIPHFWRVENVDGRAVVYVRTRPGHGVLRTHRHPSRPAPAHCAIPYRSRSDPGH